jgi:hypothetical protein
MFEFTRGRKPKYMFAKWFASSEPITLVHGVDFDMKINSFRIYLFQKAKELGYKVKTSISSDMKQITFLAKKISD